MKQIPLDKGMFAIVDDEDHDWLSRFVWRAHNPNPKYGVNFYVLSGRSGLAMHRLITDCPKRMVVDHINGNGLDNRRCNLRVCTQKDNIKNRKPVVTKRSKSKFLGVDLNRSGNKWVARIGWNKKKLHLGTFETEEEAARVYDAYAKTYFGEFVNLNFKPECRNL